MNASHKKTILVAPLNWGLGHATRCIPIINALLAHGFDVLLGSDGNALRLLEQEFPKLSSIELPSYKITYPEDGKLFRKKMLLKLPQINAAARREKKVIKKLIQSGQIHGIISDNRLGVRHKNVPSVYITHQLTVLSGATTLLSSKIHQKYIKKFDACWVPDYKDKPTLSGKLGHLEKWNHLVTYIGPLSRMNYKKVEKENDILVVLSGPEPQRTLLEGLLIKQFTGTEKKVLIVKGIVEEKQKWTTGTSVTLVNYLTTLDLEKAINASDLILCRSGYTSIMDLAVLHKKAFFIPTPGQFEQEYLAERLHRQNKIPSCAQDDFELSQLALADNFSGWETKKDLTPDFGALFRIF